MGGEKKKEKKKKTVQYSPVPSLQEQNQAISATCENPIRNKHVAQLLSVRTIRRRYDAHGGECREV